MLGQDQFLLILNCNAFKISSHLDNLSNMDQDIYKILITNHEYVVQSSVNEIIFEKFLEYLETKKIPDICSTNIDQFEKLSEEFDLMKDVIQLYRRLSPKESVLALLDTRYQHKIKLKEKKETSKNKTINYHQIIDLLFKNTELNFSEGKKELFHACCRDKINIISLFSRQKIKTENGLIFSLNIDEKTAILIQSDSNESEIYVPHSVNYKSEEFIVTSIGEGCFLNAKNLKKIKFAENSEIRTFESFCFAQSSLEEITIPSSVNKICSKSFFICISLQKVDFQADSKLRTIGKSAFSRSSLKFLSIPRHVTEICEKAFQECNQFNSIQFTDDSELRFIKESAFYRSRLTSLSIPKSVIQIGIYSFAYCKNLEKLTFLSPCSIEKSSFAYSNLSSIELPSTSFLKDGWCDSLEELDCVSVVEKQGQRNIECFDEKYILGKSNSKSDEFDVLLFVPRNTREVEIPQFITHIGSHSLANCIQLEKVVFLNDSKLRTIGESAFQNCSLENIVIPPNVERVFENGFAYCDQIKSIKFSPNSNLFSFDYYCFSWSGLVRLSIPSSFSEFKEGWCAGTPSLDEVTVFPSKNIENIMCFDEKFILGKSDQSSDVFDVLFFARRNLKEAKIPSFIRTIEKYAFDVCKNLQFVYFDEDSQLKLIEEYAFSGSFLRKVDFPPSLTKISQGSFAYCDNIEEINFPENSELISIENDAFSNSSLHSISIPSNVSKFSGKCFIGTPKLTKINVFLNKNKQNIIYFDKKYILGKSDELSNVYDVLLLARRDIKEAKIPSFVKRIGNDAFHECKKLRNVIFPDDSELVSIGPASFCSSSIINICIPDSVTRISKFAFSQCKELTRFSISNKSKLNVIERSAFLFTNLESFYVNKNISETSDFTFFGGKKIKIIEIDENANFVSFDKKAVNRDFVEIIMIPTKLKDIFCIDESI